MTLRAGQRGRGGEFQRQRFIGSQHDLRAQTVPSSAEWRRARKATAAGFHHSAGLAGPLFFLVLRTVKKKIVNT